MLYFGEDMGRSLINPNQIRSNGGAVQDDYTRNEAFGITLEEGIFIPFDMKGATIFFETRAPTQTEIEELPHVVMTGDAPWDPVNVILRIASARSNTRAIDQRNILYESDIILGTITPTLVERTTDDRIIQSVKINEWTLLPGSDARKNERGRTTSGTVTDTNRSCPISIAAVETNSRHSLVTPEEVSRKWRIGLETAQQTLRVTTQQGIRTALHPITRRYRVDLTRGTYERG
jgi:hypothetical protein